MLDGLGVAAILEEELAQVHARADVLGIDGQDGTEGGLGFLGRAQPARGETEDVLRLWHAWQPGRRFACGVAGLLELGLVEERDGEVGAGQAQSRRELERRAKRSRRIVVAVLLEQGDADVVRAAGRLDRRRGGRRGGGRDHERGEDGDGGEASRPVTRHG